MAASQYCKSSMNLINANIALKVMAAIDTTTTMPALINIATALLQMTQIIASGSDVEIVDFIGDPKCWGWDHEG